MSIKSKVISLFAPKSPVKREMFYLKRAIAKTEKKIDRILNYPEPICCHFCAFPELRDMIDKQTRRTKRLSQLEVKLYENSAKNA